MRQSSPRSADVPSAAPISRLALVLGVDAGELEGLLDPPAPPGDLKAEIDRFTTVDACVDERARLDPVLGDALEAIGYDTFLRDACRVIDATKANDASRCASIDSSALAARCRTTVAEVSGNPDACPWEIGDRPAVGRSPPCLAVSIREPRLCAGVVDALERATCEAMLARDARPCAKLRGHAAQARCARDAERWRGVLAGAPDAGTPPFAVAGALHLESTDRTGLAGPAGPAGAAGATGIIDVNLAPYLEHGVTLLEQRDGARFVLGPLTDTGVDFIAPSPHVGASLALEVVVPPGPSTHRRTARGSGRGSRASSCSSRVGRP